MEPLFHILGLYLQLSFGQFGTQLMLYLSLQGSLPMAFLTSFSGITFYFILDTKNSKILHQDHYVMSQVPLSCFVHVPTLLSFILIYFLHLHHPIYPRLSPLSQSTLTPLYLWILLLGIQPTAHLKYLEK